MKQLLNRARQALNKGDFRLAGNIYGRLIEKFPTFVPGLLEGSRAFSQLGKVNESERCLDTAAGLIEGDLEMGLHMASGYFGIGREQKSLAVLNGMYDRTGSPDIAIALAELCERLGEVERGSEVLQGVNLARGVLLKGVFALCEGEEEEGRKLFLDVLETERDDLDLGTKYRAGMELAKCYERLEEAKRAWELMMAARSEVYPSSSDVASMDRGFGKLMDVGLRSYDGLIIEESEDEMPSMLGGHLGSGVDEVAAKMVKDGGLEDLSKVNAFVRLMTLSGLEHVPVGKMRSVRVEGFRKDYFKQVRAYRPGIVQVCNWLEVGAGMERCGAYWLKMFPGAKVYLARRAPLDVIVENLFTFAPVNALTLQCFTAERAADALVKSLQIQERLMEVGGDVVKVVECNKGRGRWEQFRDFLPKNLITKFGE